MFDILANRGWISTFMDNQIAEIEARATGRNEDVEALLNFAERLHENCEVQRRRLIGLRTWFYTILLSVPLIGYLAVSALEVNALGDHTARGMLFRDDFKITHHLILGLVALIYVTQFPRLFLAIKLAGMSLASDSFALAEITRSLRESLDVLAESRNWSAFETARFRIQLSRYPIGYESQEAIFPGMPSFNRFLRRLI